MASANAMSFLRAVVLNRLCQLNKDLLLINQSNYHAEIIYLPRSYVHHARCLDSIPDRTVYRRSL